MPGTGAGPTAATLASQSIEVTDACAALLDRMTTEVAGYYAYNLYDECWYDNIISAQQQTSQQASRRRRPKKRLPCVTVGRRHFIPISSGWSSW